MIWHSSLHALIPHNPLVIRDLNYQQRTTSRLSKFIDSIGVVAVAIGFAVGMFFCLAYYLNPRKNSAYLDGIQILAWLFHAAVVLRMLTAGALSSTWGRSVLNAHELKLIPLTNRQMLVGRWWAVMHRVRGWMLALGILQAGIVFSAALGTMMYFSWSASCGPPCVYTIGELVQSDLASPVRLLPIAGSIIVIPILEMLSCTALGVACAVVFGNRFGLIAALALRFAPVLIFSFFPDYPWAWSYLMARFEQYNWFTFADGGTSAALQLARSISEQHSKFPRGKVALYAVSAMFLIYIIGSLGAAWALLRRSRR